MRRACELRHGTAMRNRVTMVLAILLAVGCGRAGIGDGDAALGGFERQAEQGVVELPSEEVKPRFELRGRIARQGDEGGTPVAGRRIEIEFSRFFIFCGMGTNSPYARMSIKAGERGEFQVAVPPVRGRGSLTSAEIRFVPAVASTPDPTPPPPPPPSEEGAAPDAPPAPYLPDDGSHMLRRHDPRSPFFKLNLTGSRDLQGTEEWKLSRWYRRDSDPQPHYRCEWKFVKVDD